MSLGRDNAFREATSQYIKPAVIDNSMKVSNSDLKIIYKYILETKRIQLYMIEMN